MWTRNRNIAVLVVITVVGALLPIPAIAHRMFETGFDPATGNTLRQEVSHRHRADGSVVVYDNARDLSYAQPYSSFYSTPYYSSSFYRPHGYSSYGYRRSVSPALVGAGIGYAIGRSVRR